jgi:hypothetical protein
MANVPGSVLVGPVASYGVLLGGKIGSILYQYPMHDTTQPTIGNFMPSVGSPLARSSSVSFDVLDEVALRRVLVLVRLGASTYCVHDGFVFRDRFAVMSTRSAIAGGFRYTVKRDGGWIEAPTFEVLAIDTSGNEAI